MVMCFMKKNKAEMSLHKEGEGRVWERVGQGRLNYKVTGSEDLKELREGTMC